MRIKQGDGRTSWSWGETQREIELRIRQLDDAHKKLKQQLRLKSSHGIRTALQTYVDVVEGPVKKK